MIYDEILFMLGEIKGELVEIRKLSERVSMLEQCQSWLKGAWAVLAAALAYPVKGIFDGFPVQDAVAAVDALPGADGAQLGRGDRGLDAEAVQVLEVIVGHVPRVAAGCGVNCGADLEVIGCPGHHTLLAVKGLLGPHENERGGLQVLIVIPSLAHRPWPRGK